MAWRRSSATPRSSRSQRSWKRGRTRGAQRRTSTGCATCAAGGGVAGGSSVRDDREHAEVRALARELVELRVAAADLVLAACVRLDPLDLAHRKRRPASSKRPEAAAGRLGRFEEVEIDFHVEHLLQAAHVRVLPRLVRVDERAGRPDARTWVDHLLAVDSAVAARHFVLYPERESLRGSVVHATIVFLFDRRPQDLTNSWFSGSGDTPSD